MAPLILPKRKKKRKGRVFPAPEQSMRLYVYIDPSKVHLFRYLLEAEDNMGIMTVVDRWRAALLVRFSPHQENSLRSRLQLMQTTVPFTVLERPWV